MKFFKKKEKEIEKEIDFRQIEYLPGSELYCGADQVFMLMCSLRLSLKMVETIRMMKPKQAAQLEPLAAAWAALYDKNAAWLEEMEKVNGSSEVFY